MIRTAVLLSLLAQAAATSVYTDAQGRFRFTHPQRFGTPSAGTNNGFGGRAAAFRFSAFPTALGGEVALTRGRVSIDIQAAGGLYDDLALEALPDALRAKILAALPPMSENTFCSIIAQPPEAVASALAGIAPAQRDAILKMHAIRNVDPKVHRCERLSGVIVFDKEASFQPGYPRQRIFGAIRFLDGTYSSVQLVAAGAPPSPQLLDELAAVVRSLVILK